MGLKDNLKELDALRRLLGLSGEADEFGAEIRRARKNRGMTLDDLAAATGMAKSYLSQIETGYASPPRDDKVRRLAGSLGLDAEILVARARLGQMPEEVRARIRRLGDAFDSTEEVMRALLAAKREQAERDRAETDEEDEIRLDLDALHASGLLHHLAEWGGGEAEPVPVRLRAVPVINKVSAGYPEEFTDMGYPVGVADEYIPAPAELDDPHAFAVRVVGDSMQPRYSEGDLVMFSPAAQVASGDDCFVRLAESGVSGEGVSTFKRVFFDDDDRIRLQPLNERYAPTFTRPSEVAGIFRAVARYETL